VATPSRDRDAPPAVVKVEPVVEREADPVEYVGSLVG
jgi:hypothetical protein